MHCPDWRHNGTGCCSVRKFDADQRLCQRHHRRSEGFCGEAMTWHGLSDAVRRGLENMKIQACLLAAADRGCPLAALSGIWIAHVSAEARHGNTAQSVFAESQTQDPARARPPGPGSSTAPGPGFAGGNHRRSPRWLRQGTRVPDVRVTASRDPGRLARIHRGATPVFCGLPWRGLVTAGPGRVMEAGWCSVSPLPPPPSS